MFKTLETKWNAHTPVYLHNGTKENIIFQFAGVLLLMAAFFVQGKWTERHDRKKYNMYTPEND